MKSSTTIQQYNKELEVENILKKHQIDALKKQIDLLSLSTKLQVLNTRPVCAQCIRKQQQIDTLIKALKALRVSGHTKKPTLIDGINEQNSILTQQNLRNAEPNSLYINQQEEENQTTPQYTNNEIGFKYSNANKVQFSTEGNEFNIEGIMQLNVKYQNEIQILKKRVQFLSHKIMQLQKSSKTLKIQTLNKQQSKVNLKHSFMPYSSSRKQAQFKNDNQPAIQYFYTTEPKKKIPAFSSIRNQVTKNSVLLNPEIRTPITTTHKNQIQHASASRNSLMDRLKQKPRCDCDEQNSQKEIAKFQAKSLMKNFRGRGEILIQERRKSLNHKIKVLENQNRRLRTQVYSNS